MIKYIDAITAFSITIDIAGPEPTLNACLADSLALLGKIPEAIETIDVGLELDPHHVKSCCLKGKLLVLDDRPTEAVEFLKTAIEWGVRSYVILLSLA